MSVIYDNTSPYRPIESWLYNRVIAPAVMELARPVDKLVLDFPNDGAKILEIGCGGGQLAEHIAKRRSDVSLCGVDLSPEQIRRAWKRCSAWRDRLTFIQGTALNLEFSDGSFDAVISVASIKHWPDKVNPIVAKVGGLQSQGGKREAVIVYCERLPTQDLESSGFPAG